MTRVASDRPKHLNTYDKADAIGIVPQKPSQIIESVCENLAAGIACGVIGSPGGGKTQSMEEVARRMKKRYMFMLLNGKDPCDIGGLPFVYNDPFNNKRHSWTLADFYRCVEDDLEDGYPGGWLWNLDDLPQAVPSLQNRAGEILHGHTLNGKPIHPAVSIVWTGNFSQDRSATFQVPSQIPNRSNMMVYVTDGEDFRRVMSQRNRRPEVIAFTKFREECLDSFDPQAMLNCTARSLESVSLLMDRNPSPDRELQQYSGLIGKGYGAEFTGFLRVYRDLPKLEDIIARPTKHDIPDEDATDVMCALAAMLGRALEKSNAAPLVKYLVRLPVEFCVFALRDAVRRDPELKKCAAIRDWAVDHGDVLF